MDALVLAMRGALEAAGVDGGQLAALALDTTGSSVIPVGEGLTPLDDYYLWCDHRAKGEAAEITAAGRREKLEALAWCGGVYSSEWGFSKLLHWLRANPDKRAAMVTALEHCDMVAAVLCGITDPREAPRSVCAMGHKWMWSRELGGLPPRGVPGRRSIRCWPACAPNWTAAMPPRTKLPAGFRRNGPGSWGCARAFPIPVGAFDAHWDAIGAGVREGDVVNVVGTSTCIMAIAKQVDLIPGVCGVVKGSIHPRVFRNRSRPVGDRRYFRRHRTAGRHHGGRSFPRAGALSRRPNGAAAAHLG